MKSHALSQSLASSASTPEVAPAPLRSKTDRWASLDVVVRPAIAEDQAAITALVRSERLNPNGLNWERFWVAVCDGAVIAAAQIRQHPDGAREVGSVVVGGYHRRRGVASRVLEALLSGASGDLYLVTGEALIGFYRRWGFEPISVAKAPRSVRADFWLGQLIGGALSCLQGRCPRRLHILRRAQP